MKNLIKKYHCPECDEDLTMLNSDEITDVTDRTLDGEPKDGTYSVGVVTCTKCGTKSISYEWWRTMNGYDEIQKLKS